MKEGKDYVNFNTNDFLRDSYFLEWMRKDNAEANAFWKQWEKDHPEKVQVIAEAKELYQTLVSFDPVHPTLKEREDTWKGIDSMISEKPIKREKNILHIQGWRWVAAAVAILIIGGSWFLFQTHDPKEAKPENFIVIQSGNKMKKIILSDSSTIFLDRYTTLKYRAENGREFWIDGQAFFDVKHQHVAENTAAPFIVHAGIEDVTVLGTSFTMKSIDSTAEVILIRGKLKTSIKDKAVMMKPGEKTAWQGKAFITKQVNPQLYLAWKTGEFRFDHTSLKELKELIKDYYGYDLVIRNKSILKTRTISGTVSAKDEAVLWKAIALMFHVKVERQGKEVILTAQ